MAPTRKGLILSAAVVALHGYRDEMALQARHFKYDDPKEYKEYAECVKAIDTLKSGGEFKTDNVSIHGLMARTCQILRVSYEEWEACVRVSRITPTNEPT